MVDVGDINLHVACQGAGPTIFLLHGFPEFWYSWQKTMDILAQSYRVIAPDQRGYNLSDKPPNVSDYTLEHLSSDIGHLINRMSEEPIVMVGHDWGGPVAWTTAHENPDTVRLMVSTNGPHPDVMTHLLETDPEQQQASSYIDWFVLEGTEDLLIANDCAALDDFFGDLLSASDLERYHEAWLQDDAIKSGLHWYRAHFGEMEGNLPTNVTIDVPTLVLWGLDDTALLPQQVDGLEAYAPDVEVLTYEGISHWIEHEMPEEIAAQIDRFIQEHPTAE